jgi:xylulokinase
MKNLLLSFDLGTGGNKASLYTAEGACLASAFEPYDTHYPRVGWHEQAPQDWWRAVVASTQKLLALSKVDPREIAALGISGHSLGAVPMDKEGRLLREYTPIWSDVRAQLEAADFFSRVDADHWYATTGNGFPAACYTVFKVMWYRAHEPEIFARVAKILGTKDYINYRLTGVIKTDHSYASGTGVYDLLSQGYAAEFIAASGLEPGIWPEITASTEVLGGLTPAAAQELGLDPSTLVVCGGVDNSCMALGAKNTHDGRVYTSLGSSAWIAVSSTKPVLDTCYKPYVFAHVIPGMYTSAVSIFSAGTTYNWVKDNLCQDLAAEAASSGEDVYLLMNREAAKAPVGSNKLLFNPSLAGGNSQDPSVNLRGGYIGLDLKHGQPELIRAAMEGIAMNLRLRLDLLRKYTRLEDEILFVGGGAKSRFYLGIFADVFNARIIKSTIDQDAAALGAAALAAVGGGLWQDFSRIDAIHHTVEVVEPVAKNQQLYARLLPIFERSTEALANLGELLHEIELEN